jgi:hypothetical protein
MSSQEIKEAPLKNTTDKEDPNKIETVLQELPQLLVNHAYKKLKSGEDLTASEMKVCLEVCKTYSKEPLTKKEDNILDEVPFDNG